MKHLLLAIASTAILLTATTQGAVEEHYEEKPIKIPKAKIFDEEKHVKIHVGDKVTFKIKVYQDKFFGQTTISANANIDNSTDQKVKAIYSISFHDKDGKLVACHQGSWDLDPDDDVNYGSGIIYTDEKSIATVTNYKLRTLVVKSDKD